MNAGLRYSLSVFGLLILWKLAAEWAALDMLPPPEIAFAEFGHAVKSPRFWSHFLASSFRVICAMSAAWLIGFPVGILIGYYRLLDQFLSPVIFLTYPIPKIVLLPVFLVVFGLGDFSRIFIIALIIGYQILVATRDSVLQVNSRYLDAFRSMGGGPIETITHVLIPAALPQGFTALRIGAGTAVAVLFFVESFATESGLGFFIMDSWGRFDGGRMFVGIMGMSLLGVLLVEVIDYLERTFCAWKFVETGRQKPAAKPGILLQKIGTYGHMIKFSHTVFALPFALAAVILANRHYPITGLQIVWILTAMVAARSAAMGFNRIVDARIDAQNPRTSDREIPAGRLSQKSAAWFVLISAVLFFFSAGMLSRLCLILSVPVLGILFLYSYTKRFTALSHVYLGFSISMAPLGVWVAVSGQIDWPILLLCLALLTYIAGFDILYACQDLDFDRSEGLFSIPARLGASAAFHMASLLHLVTFVCLFFMHLVFDMGPVYLFTVLIIGVLLIVEHRMVRPDDLSRIQAAFFHVNSAISVLLFLGILGNEFMQR